MSNEQRAESREQSNVNKLRIPNRRIYHGVEEDGTEDTEGRRKDCTSVFSVVLRILLRG